MYMTIPTRQKVNYIPSDPLVISGIIVQVQVSSSSLLRGLEYTEYDVPLVAVSYSYSRRAVVWRIELNIILQCTKITYRTNYELGIK